MDVRDCSREAGTRGGQMWGCHVDRARKTRHALGVWCGKGAKDPVQDTWEMQTVPVGRGGVLSTAPTRPNIGAKWMVRIMPWVAVMEVRGVFAMGPETEP